MTDIRYRPMAPTDFDAMAALVGEVWYDAPDVRTAQLMGSVDLATCLRRTTYSQVVLVDGELAGFILARVGLPGPQVDAEWARAADDATRELRACDPAAAESQLAYLQEVDDINARLLAEGGVEGRCEVVLFLLASAARGLGVGRALFDGAEGALAQRGAREVFLFTDDSCTWGFYEHRGMRRAAEFHPGGDAPGGLLGGYYLYTEELNG